MKRITDIMSPFSVVPEWVRLGKQSACRLGVMCGMELARASHPGLRLELLAGGFPELKADGSPFSKENYMKLHKETRLVATQIADGIELSRLEAGYDSQSKRRKMSFPVPSEFSLLPPPTESSELAGRAEPASGAEEDERRWTTYLM